MVKDHLHQVISSYIQHEFSHEDFKFEKSRTIMMSANLIIEVWFSPVISVDHDRREEFLERIAQHFDLIFTSLDWISQYDGNSNRFGLTILLLGDQSQSIVNQLLQVENEKDLAKMRLELDNKKYQVLRRFIMPYLVNLNRG